MYMSYRIEYDSRVGKYEVCKERGRGGMPILLSGIGIIVVFSLLLWPEAGAAVRSYLIPGEDAVTVQAFHNMSDDLRSGADLKDALYTFCRHVIHGG